MKKAIALVLCLVMCFALVACGDTATSNQGAAEQNNSTQTNNTATQAPQSESTAQTAADASRDADGNGRPDRVYVALPSDPVNLLPWDSKTNSRKSIYCAIYDTLFDFIDGQYVPNIAIGYNVIDPTHWEIPIHDNVYDWAGNHMTAADIEFCYNNYVNSGYAVKFDNFVSMEATDDFTLMLTMVNEPTGVAALDHVLTNVQLYCEAAWNEAGFASSPVATGPYKLVEYTSGSKVVVEANEDYWNGDNGTYIRQRNADSVEFDIIAEAAQNVVGLKTGALDYSANVPSENLAEFAADPNFTTISRAGTEIVVIYVNCDESSPLHDTNLRLALFYAIDNEALASVVPGTEPSKGYGSPAAPDYVSKWDSESTYFNTYDPAKAAELLAASDYDGSTKIKIMSTNTEAMKNTAQMIQVFWEAIGVQSEIETADMSTVAAKSSQLGQWDVQLNTAGGSFLVNSMNRLYNNREFGGEYCNGFIRDAKLQELFETANTASTWGEDSLDALYQYICENGYHYTILYQTATAVASNIFDECAFWDNDCIPSASAYRIG